MTAGSVIEHFDVIEDVGFRQIACFVNAFLDSLLFQATKERFGHRVIPTVTASAHARFEMMLATEAHPIVAAILRTLIGMDQRVLRPTTPYRHEHRIEHQLTASVGFIDQPMILRA